MIHAIVYPQASIRHMPMEGKVYVYLVASIAVIVCIVFIVSMQRNQGRKP